jgi:uncharacterized protein YjbJ (UPF0337 family)
MDKDRIKGSAQQTKGKVKEVAGKLTGDAKLQSEGKADKAAGKVRNVVGGIKDTLRGNFGSPAVILQIPAVWLRSSNFYRWKA